MSNSRQVRIEYSVQYAFESLTVENSSPWSSPGIPNKILVSIKDFQAIRTVAGESDEIETDENFYSCKS